MENNWLCNPLCHLMCNIACFGLRLYVQRCVPIRAWAPISVPSLLRAVSRTPYRSDAIHESSGFSALAQRRYSKEKLNKTSSGADTRISNHRTSEWCDYSSSTCSNARARARSRAHLRVVGTQVCSSVWKGVESSSGRICKLWHVGWKQVSTLVRSRILSIWVLCVVIPANLLGVYPSSTYDVNVEDRRVSSSQLRLIVYHSYRWYRNSHKSRLLFIMLRVWGPAVEC